MCFEEFRSFRGLKKVCIKYDTVGFMCLKALCLEFIKWHHIWPNLKKDTEALHSHC